jgi:hypothetical protein
MTRRLLLPLCLLATLVVAPAASAADPLPLKPKQDASPFENERLSNERTLTRWGHTNLLGKIRSKPSTHGKTIAKLRWNTEDGLPEVYVVLESRLDEDEQVWLKIRIPGRPNGRTGWVQEEQLSNLKAVETAQGRQEDLVLADRRRRARHDHAEGPLLDPGAPLQPRRQPALRALGVRHIGLLRHADRLAGGRRRGHPRHQPARAHPRPPVARVRARAEREDPQARPHHAGGHAGADPLARSGRLAA